MSVGDLASLDDDGYFRWHCPGCDCSHRVPVHPAHPNGWTLAGSLEAPTLSPSVLVRGAHRCHSFIRGGQIEFLSDCDHDLASTTVAMVSLN